MDKQLPTACLLIKDIAIKKKPSPHPTGLSEVHEINQQQIDTRRMEKTY